MDSSGHLKNSRLLLLAAGILAIGLVLWHGLSYRSLTKQLETEVAAAGSEIQSQVAVLESSAAFPLFIAAAERLNALPARIAALESRASKLADASTFIQRPFGALPSPTWKDEITASLRSLYPALPVLFLSQDMVLGRTLLSKIPDTPPEDDEHPELRQMAIDFMTNRNRLHQAAEAAERLAGSLGWPGINIQASLEGSSDSRELERWIDFAAEVDTKSKGALERAMATANSAAGATAQLDPDAGATQIAAVLSQWVAAEAQAQEAYSIATESPAPDSLQPLVFELLYPRTSQVGEAISQIGSSRASVEQALRQAREEESSFTGALFRVGRRSLRAASGALQQLGSKAGEQLSVVSARVDQGIAESMIAASQAVDKGIEIYQETRKPGWQRFLESPGGGGFFIAGGVVILALVLAAVALSRK